MEILTEIMWTSSAAMQPHMLDHVQLASSWLEQEPYSKTKTPSELAQLDFGLLVLGGAEKEKPEPLGFGALSQIGKCAWELSSVVVHPEHRGKGVGGFIVGQLTQFFFEYGEPLYGDLCLVCVPHLQPFYENYGYTALGKPPKFLDTGLQQKAIYAIQQSKTFMLATIV